MPTYFARKAGNINATDVWATTPSGTAAAVTFVAGDVLMANSFVITVNVSTDLGATGEVRNDTTGGATAGGSFALNSGITLTASIFNSTSATAVTFSAASPASSSIVASQIRCFGTINAPAVNNSGSGTLTITATTITGGAAGGGSVLSSGVLNSTTGTINITCSGGITGGSAGQSPGVANASSGVLIITGNCRGGSVSASAYGAVNSSTGVTTIIGSAIGSSLNNTASGAFNASTGQMNITRAVGNAFGPGNTSGLAAAVGASNAGLGVIEIEQLEYGTFGMSPTSGTGIRLKKLSSNVAIFNFCDTAGAKTLIDATQNAAMPAATDVRNGVSYAGGAATGTCAVPAAGSVSLGVPVDAGFGTAVLTPAAVWGHATRTLTAGAGITAADVWSHSSRTITGGTVTTLTNAPTVPTPSQIASQVRTELSVELGRVDQAISSRATAGDIPTESEIAAEVWAKPTTELTITGSIGERAKNQSTVSTTGAQLAAALS